jgi:putative peptidoglycan lipid II flippase
VLVLTQLMNIALVPWLAHAGLALSIGLGALLNAGWLLVGLLRRGSWKPAPGWWKFLAQVVAGTVLLALFLMWAAAHFDWLALRSQAALRVALLGGMTAASAAIYFGALWAAGVNLRQFVTR